MAATRRPRQSAGAAKPLPWWLAGSDESCPHCEQTYVYEVEVRCVDCDGPMCPICATWVEKHSFCRDCVPSPER